MMQPAAQSGQDLNSTVVDKVHPVIRIVIFLIFAGFVSLAGSSQLIVGALLLVTLYCLAKPAYLISAFGMIRRMRWFFLSIFIIYSWLTPGQAVAFPFTAYASWLPTTEGIVSGLMRAASLSLILMGVNLLLRCTSRQQLVMALYWLASPLRVLGISRERLSIRIALVLEMIGEVQEVVRDAFAEVRGRVRSLDDIGAFAAGVFHKVTRHAENMPVNSITIDGCHAPAALQWLLPVMMCMMFVAAGLILK
jgi:hypothetical protein